MRKHWIVFIEDGYTKLMSPNGEVFHQEIKGVLTSEVNLGCSIAEYTATFEVKLAPNYEEALKMTYAKTSEEI